MFVLYSIRRVARAELRTPYLDVCGRHYKRKQRIAWMKKRTKTLQSENLSLRCPIRSSGDANWQRHGSE